MWPTTGIVLSIAIASVSTQLTYKLFDLQNETSSSSCFVQKGIALSWAKPFAIQGEVIGIVEGLRSSENYYPVSLHSNCLVARFDLQENYVTFVIEQRNRFQTSLLLTDHINDVDFTVEQYGKGVKFYGCSANYRTILAIYPRTTCGNNHSAGILMSYHRLKSELPRPFLYQEVAPFKELGRMTPIGTISSGFRAILRSENGSPRVGYQQWSLVISLLVLRNA